MRTVERLRKFRQWTYETVCQGREMKTPAPNMDVRKIVRQEPKVYLAFTPTRPDDSRPLSGEVDPLNVTPGIIIMPVTSYAKYMEEQRFDRYNNVHRPKEMGQSLSVQVLFFVYEDGVRLPGFIDNAINGAYDMSLISDGTQEGVETLLNWMDDFRDALLGLKSIPGTDMFLNEAEMTYGLYSDQHYVADRRPVYIGYVTVTFQCHADEYNETIERLLR